LNAKLFNNRADRRQAGTGCSRSAGSRPGICRDGDMTALRDLAELAESGRASIAN